jgi:5-methyltetrahydrofolate--homocysteine methyltransferase
VWVAIPSPELLGRLDPSASTYLQALAERVVIFDGAMGTNLQMLGLGPDDFGGPDLEGCNEWLVETRPEVVAQVHRSFYEVGCDVVETDTFGSTSVVLAEYGLADRARELTRRAAELACAVRDEFSTPERPRWVAGSMGPGTKFPTLGHISYAEFSEAYEEQALGLLEGGVDLLLIETQFDMLSIKAAVNGARRAMVALDRYVPLQAQVTIELTGRMLPGTEIAAALTVLDAMQVDAIGLNCATGPVEMSEALRHLSGASRVPIACVPNAGLPSVVDGKMHDDLTPEQLADHLHRFVTEFGVSVVGGCCGTTPEHLAAVVERCAHAVPLARTPVFEPSAASIYTSVPFHQDTSFLVVGERTNANGSKRFREAMLEADWDTCVAMARDQVAEGSHLIDVCVDYTGADGVADMIEVASRFATQASVPLMVDSTEGPVVRAALEWIGGRPVLNSVNLEEGDGPGTRLDTFLRLAREFGAAVVCTCIDEEGQARTAQWKLRAARNIRDIAVERYGLEPEDLLFDPLALPLSTGMEESRIDGIETIEGIRAIKSELPGVSTILGLSNVSFGLNPAARQVLNSVFLHECVEAGLDSAIVHASKILPLSRIDERAKEISLDLVYNRRTDDYDPLQELLALFDGVKVNTGAQDEHLDWPVDRRLSQRIIDGNRTGLEADLTEALDSDLGALAIVNDILLEGMKVVGERFASGEMQLPFVLQSAETMKAAVAFLEPFMEKADQGGKGTVVLATVKGDVHDIGKNLVDIILTNNGYEVVNLGIKIGINEMIAAAEEHRADAIGMSGLLVKSTLIMRENLVELNQRELADVPILLGGAALTRTYVERDLREVYDGRLFYGRDAFEGLRTMDRLVEMKKTGEEDPLFGREISEKKVPKRSRLEPQDTAPVEGQPARSDVAADNKLFVPPFVGTGVAKGMPLDDVAEYLNLTALFRNQWQFRPESGEDDTEFKDRVRAILRQELAKAKEGDLLVPQVAYGHFAANAEGNDLIIWKDEARNAEWMRFTFPRQRKEPWLCISDFFRSTESGDEDFASFMLCTIGDRASEEAARLKEDNQYQSYLFLHGLSVEMAEATA